MSFIIKDTHTPFIVSKLTEYGRSKLAKGELNFTHYIFGDSEVDYRYINQLEPNGAQILLPKDNNPKIKTLLVKTDKKKTTKFDSNDKKVVKNVVHRAALKRGFSENGLLKTDYFKTTGFMDSTSFNGMSHININTIDFKNGDFIIFKCYHEPTNNENNNSVVKPVQWLTYKIRKTPASTVVELDRNLPNYLNFTQNKQIMFFILPNKDAIDTFFSTNANILWDDTNLSFKRDCLIEDTKVWNFNVVYSENVIGTKLSQHGFQKYKSFDYIGEKEYLGYNLKCVAPIDETDCLDKLNSIKDDFYKNIGIIHYTNKNTVNNYAEFFYINHEQGKRFKLELPTIMWHQRSDNTLLGMNFVSNGVIKYVENSNIPYYDLIDEIGLIGGKTPKVVGRVFHTLKIITLHDSELLAALTYKSNRNYTLPSLKAKMVSPTNGIGTGILPKGKTCFLTYTLESNDNTQIILPQQNYIKCVNTTNIDKDIEFDIEDVGLLKYMRQKEKTGYDGLGFYAHKFKLLYQIVDNGSRPLSEAWKSCDYTNNFLTVANGNTIDPLRLENQNNRLTGFVLNTSKPFVDFELDYLSLSDDSCPDSLYFGEENVLFGNVECHIGANVFKSVLELTLDEGDFESTENPTWTKNKNLWVSEMAILDNDYKEVMIVKLFKSIEIKNQTVNLFELSMDF